MRLVCIICAEMRVILIIPAFSALKERQPRKHVTEGKKMNKYLYS